jgi:ATP-dependent DNA helicase RecQ
MLRSDEEKMRELVKLCKEIKGTGIVYTRSRQKTEELARLLKREGVRAAFYHAGMDSEDRKRVQEEFMDDRWRVICATVAFGMGIDKPDVRFVIHYSLPDSLESYYQEAGRSGRDGLDSRCILLYTTSDKQI